MHTIRQARPADVEATFEVRAATRECAIPRARLEARGITVESVTEDLARDTFRSWVAECDGRVVGFCNAYADRAEVQALAVRDGYEGRGIGRELLQRAIAWLRERGCGTLCLYTSPRADWRAFHVYREHGWKATGETLANGDERLELRL